MSGTVPADGFITHEALIALLDASPVGILMMTDDGHVKFSNLAAQRLFGYERDQMLGAPVESLIPHRYRSHHVAERMAYAEAAQPRPMGLGLRIYGLHGDGTELPVEVSLAPMEADGERLTVTIVRDATEQRLAEEQRMRYERARAVEEIVAGLEAIVWESTAPDRESLTYLDGCEEAFLGYSRERWLKRGFWLAVVHPEDRVAALTLAATALASDTFELEYRLIAADGAVHHVRDIVSVTRGEDGKIERMRGVIVDMTERHELEDRLARAQKMEAVGALAGGIAHDFNNLLTIVSGYARRLRGRPGLTDAASDLDQIITATDRAAELTGQLLSFARRGRMEAVLLEPGELIRALEPTIRGLLDADIVLDIQLDRHVPCVLMDRTQLEQILMNLILNASDAMSNGGTLTITTRTRGVSDQQAAGRGALAGDYVELAVSDTGTGMPAELRERIFEPFFTTKRGRGTGMGLATVHGTVEQAGGWIELESEPGVGTTFQILLPVATPPVPVPAAASTSRTTLLLVEDEPALRQLVATMLEEDGYTVLQAGNGLDAVSVAGRHFGKIDLLITDVAMPRLAGPELARKLQRLRPGLQVLYMSGYNDSRLVSRGVAEAKVRLLVKPFTPDELLAIVRELTSATSRLPASAGTA